jgi:hypothetical protein
MTTLAYRLALGAGLLVVLAASDRPARACGGCFIRPSETTVVTDHRMAFAISTQQSVLWDQIKYSGNPADFSWVLPVRPGTVVQVSSDAWFSALDAMTTPTITGPTRSCNNNSSAGCGAARGFGSAGISSDNGSAGVQVVSQAVIGPYHADTLRATDPNALENWLSTNGYELPPAFQPTIAAYVAGGFDFIALRLRPGEGVQAMQPVRVVTQGADVTLPLRMVAAGVGAQVGVTLYVVAEGRYEAAPPFQNAVIDDSKLVWLHLQNTSNYQELSQTLMQQNGGRTWLTEYSQRVDVTSSVAQRPCGLGATQYYYGGQSLTDLYLSQCSCDAGSPLVLGGQDASDDVAEDTASPADGAAMGASDGAAEAAAVSTADAAGNPLGNQTFGSSYSTSVPACTGDDVEVALTGLDPANVWVTRLRAILPANALSEHDLLLQASSTQTSVSNQHSAANYDDPSYSPCGTQGSCAASDARGSSGWLEGGALCFVAAAGFRRAKRRGPRNGGRVSGTSRRR